MNAATTPLLAIDAAGPVRRTARYVWSALRSATPQELLFTVAVAVALCGAAAMQTFDCCSRKAQFDFESLMPEVFAPLLCWPFVLGAWLLADRAEGKRLPRTLRLTVSGIGAASAAALLVPLLLRALGLPGGQVAVEDGRILQLPLWVESGALAIEVVMFAALAFGPLEWRRRRAQAQRALDDSLSEQAALSRQVLESRLAAMQAQVEPQFLFDTLVGIEQLYARDAVVASTQLDRLITYLRVALPRLREAGSTIGAEIELVQSYLGVVQAGAGGAPQLRLAVEPLAAERTFHPMLLLPLVQRAVRDQAALPASVEIAAQSTGPTTTIALRFDRGGLCDDDDELRRVQGRLHALYGREATLHCDATRPDRTEFTLRLPAE
jgi:hypothetical protein